MKHFIKKTIPIFFMLLLVHLSEAQIKPIDLFNLKQVVEVAISPDAKHIAYTLNVPRPFTDAPGGDYRELYVYNIAGAKTKPLIRGNKLLFSLNWGKNSDIIYFRANMPGVQGVQVYGIDINGGEAYNVTNHKEGIRAYDFLNNNTIVFSALDPIDPKKTKLLKEGFDAEFYEEETRDINLHLFNIHTQETKQITKDAVVFDFAVNPDGTKIAAAIAPNNLVDDSYMFKRIHVLDLRTLKLTMVMENPGKLGKMVWSPDGKKIAFIAASDLHDSVEGSLFVIDVPTQKKFKELRNYVEGFRGSVQDISWKDNTTLMFSAEEGVDIVLSEIKLNAKERKILLPAESIIFRGFHHVGNLVAMAGNTAAHPSELFLFDIKKTELKRLTYTNKWLDDIKLARQEKISYFARDSLDIEGVLVYPLNYKEGQKYPLIVYIHGGPEAAVQNGWTTFYSRWGQIAATDGFFVFMPNYRASSGRGVEFTMQGFGDLVGKEYDDVIDGIDYLIEKGMVDKNRVGIGGGSYGGYFAAWSATKHSERFAASVVFVGIGNQVSKRNTTDIPYEDYYVHWGFWTHENHEKVYDASPVKYAHKSQTPTLVLHGKDDPRIHVSQGLEIYRTLKLHGKAPVRLVLYPGEGHGNRKNTSRLDYIVRTMAWFNYYLKDGTDKSKMPEKYIDFDAIIGQ